MPLIRCKQCNQWISDNGKPCPKCGSFHQKNQPMTSQCTKNKSFIKNIFINDLTREIVGKTIGLLVLMAIVFGATFLVIQGGKLLGFFQEKDTFVASVNSYQPSNKPSYSSPKTSTRDMYITNGGYVAAFRREDLDMYSTCIAQGDKAAAQTLIDRRKVFVLKGGLEVYLDETSGFIGSLVKIRMAGDTSTVWTYSEAIKHVK